MTSRSVLERALTTFNEETKIWQGIIKTPTSSVSESSIGAAVLSALLENPDGIAQICYPSDKEYTNREIAKLSVRVALNLQKLSLAQKDVIGLCAGNSDFVAPLTFGALLCGLAVSTQDPSFDREGIAHIFSITRPKLMFCDGDIYDKVKDALEGIGLVDTVIYTVTNHRENVPSLLALMESVEGENDFKAPALQDGQNQLAMILCSSGTTGPPKGVTMSHASLLSISVIKLKSSHKFLCFSSLYWLSGLAVLISETLRGTTRVISNRPYSPDDFIEIVERYKVTTVLSPPSQIALTLTSERIHSCDLSSIKVYFAGGSAVPYTLAEKLKKYATNADFFVGYGMSEVNGCIAVTKIAPSDHVGQLLNNTEVKIINENGESLSRNEVGEICIRTPHPWAGYYNNPEATSQIYDKDRWVHSGDIGYFDDQNNLYIVDRKKDILKFNNFHFNPTQIENVIMELKDVAQVCVCGIPDIVYTYLPAAAVVKFSNSDLTESMIYDHAASKMQHFELLRGGVYFFDSLPHTASGKTRRNVIAELCTNIYEKKKCK